MIKQIKNIITSKIFILSFILSLIVLVTSFIIYFNNSKKYNHAYDIAYYEDISEYEEIINMYKDSLEELDKRDEYYAETKELTEQYIKIYENLIKNNIKYTEVVYDGNIEYTYERSAYLILTENIIMYVILFNAAIIIYLAFTREFDGYKYSFIYESSRYKMIINKIMASLIVTLFVFIVYYLINFVCSLRFEKNFEYVLIVEKGRTYFQNISRFIIDFNLTRILYSTIFYFIILWCVALIGKKTPYSILMLLGLFVIVVILFLLGFNFSINCGLTYDFSIKDYDKSLISRFSILIPMMALGLDIFAFEKSDL